MTSDLLYYNITCISFYLLAFISFFNPARVNAIANRWFGVFLFSTGSALLNVIIYTAHAEAKYPQLISFNELSRYAMAPALYLSVSHFTSAEKAFNRKEYLHFIPFLFFFIFIGPVAFLPGFKIFHHNNFIPILKPELPVLIFLSVKIQVLIYWILSYRKLNRHQNDIRLVTSNTAPVNLNWLKLLLLGIAFMILLWFNDLFFGIGFIIAYAPLGYLGGALFICYFLLAQKEIYPYEKPELADIDRLINREQKNVVAKERFPSMHLNQLKDKLTRLMETESLYLDNELSLPQLAKEMGISSHDLSYLLNEGFGINFFQFINAYRVEEAKQLMLSEKHKHLNILGIAYSAGFNSKTTFNTAFKKETGLSPSQFIQQIKNESAPVASFQ